MLPYIHTRQLTTHMLLALQDQVKTLEAANGELKRLLRKETLTTEAFATPTLPPGCCSQCGPYRTAFLAMRKDNVQEYKWVEHFQKTSHGLQTRLQERLNELESAHSALQIRYRDLEQRKDDPYCRDAEIVRMRENIAELTQRWMNANQTAVNANRETKSLFVEIDAANDKMRKLEGELIDAKGKIRQQQDTIEAYEQLPELRDQPVGKCTDFRCKKRDFESQMKVVDCEEQVKVLAKENHDLLEQVKKFKNDDKALVVQMENKLPPIFMFVEQNSKPTVANMEKFYELKLSLRSFFGFYPANDEEYEEATMYNDFLMDLHPADRETKIGWIYAACHDGKSIPETTLEQFRKKSTDDRLELVCRSCFAACMLALGGNFRKVGKKTVWLNVRANRRRF